MRYATDPTSASGQARSRRIGRCARCHAPVLADEDHYGTGDALVHGACGAQTIESVPAGSAGAAPPPRPAVPPARAILRLAPRPRTQHPVPVAAPSLPRAS